MITNTFNSIEDIGWYGSAYVLASCSTQLLFGRLYLFYSNKIVFIISVIIFMAGSAVCGAAPTSTAFIIGRALAGCGAAGIFSGVTVVMIPMVPLGKRPMYQGMMGSLFGISSVIGPLIGGAFTKSERLTWRWCFYINLPLGAVSLLIVLLFLHIPPPPKADLSTREKLIRLDPVGTLLFMPAVISLLLALQWGGLDYPWSNPRVVALLVLFGVLLISWIATQIIGKENATLPPRIILQRSVAAGLAMSCCIGGVMLSLGFYLPVWFQAILGVDALQSGIRQLPFILALVVAAIVAGGVVTKSGYYTPCLIVCSCLMATGAGLLTTLRVDSGSSQWIGYQFLLGFGMGLGQQQSGLAAQTVLKPEDVPVGVSLMFFGQSLGGAVFICVAQNIFIQQLFQNLRGVVGDANASLLEHVGATDLRNYVPSELLSPTLVAYNKSITTTFYVAVAIASLSIIPALTFEWKSIKGLRGPKGEGNISAKGDQ